MLPDKMENFLEAPVPFVVGTIRKPESIEIPDDVLVLSAPTDTLISNEPLPPLPQFDELYPFHFIIFLFS